MLAYAGQYSLFGALILATLPALGGGVVRDLLLQRDPLGIVRNPEALLIVFGTVLAGMVVIKLCRSCALRWPNTCNRTLVLAPG